MKQVAELTVGSSNTEKKTKTVMVNQFVSFHEGCLIGLDYLKGRPIRDYGVFETKRSPGTNPLPEICWDTKVVFCARIHNIRRIVLHNYKYVQM
jgi:hypothetical protein